ncbi:hypothetical protein [Streptomyces atratus]|uniref:hypothetical protein n=1 Tax=Streptomyces atratus TaxID=1893 RepID=UPI0033DC9FAE
MNTFMNLLGIAVLFALVLLPTLVGIARERRIDRRLRDAERGRRAKPRGTQAAAVERHPYVRGWARI